MSASCGTKQRGRCGIYGRGGAHAIAIDDRTFGWVGPAGGRDGDACHGGLQEVLFLVNDYGKDGPTKDAKDLLDKYIGEWMKEKGISKFTVGNKDVKCELFLNLIVVDEHTCTATANVCWDDEDTHQGDQELTLRPAGTGRVSLSFGDVPADTLVPGR